MSLQAFVARRVVTPEGIRPAAVLVDGERIQAVVAPDQIPAGYAIHDFGDAAILPGWSNSHVHIDDPAQAATGRASKPQPAPPPLGVIPCWSICR